MKIKLLLIATILFISTVSEAQVKNASQKKFNPYYITFTRLHGYDSVDKDKWRAIEKEFFQKVTRKNKYILHYEFLVNYSENSPKDFIIMKVFKTWNDIQLAEEETNRLIEEAWPDAEKRVAFFEKMNENYELYYSNSIYRSTLLATFKSKVTDIPGQPKLFYVLRNKLIDYQGDDSLEAYERYIENVTYKNPYIRSYLAQKHFFGPDSRDFIEIYVVDSLEDLMKSFDKDKALLKEMIPDEKAREKFIDVYNKGVRRSSSELYINIPSLSK